MKSSTDASFRRRLALCGMLCVGACGGSHAPRTVQVTRQLRYVTERGDQIMPADMTAQPLELLVQDRSGGFTSYQGTASPDGTFSFAEVPRGAFYLHFKDVYILTDADHVDLGEDRLGRPDARDASVVPTTLVFNGVQGMASWQTGDSLQLYAPGAGAYDELLVGASRTPAAGDSTLYLTKDWTRALAPRLVDGGRGDTLYVTQLTMQTNAPTGLRYRAVDRVFKTDSAVQRDGQTAMLSGSFERLMTSSSTTVPAWRRSRFDQFLHDVHPSAQRDGHAIYYSTLPASHEHGFFGDAADLVALYDMQPDDIDLNVLNYVNPYPRSWGQMASVIAYFYVEQSVPGASPSKRYGNLENVSELIDFIAQPTIEPALSPVTSPRINERSAFDAQDAVTTTPTLRWDPPARGTAAGVVVYVWRLYADQGATKATRVARIHTAGRSVTIPPGVLTEGQYYFFALSAWSWPGLDFVHQPFRSTLPIGHSVVLTGRVSP